MDTERIEGPEGIRHLFDMTLQSKDKLLRVALSDRPLVYLVSEDYAEKYIRHRERSAISLRSLRFNQEQANAPSRMDDGSLKSKEIRTAPAGYVLKKSAVIWDCYVGIVDTESVSGEIIRSIDHAEAMKAWFDELWDESRPQ